MPRQSNALGNKLNRNSLAAKAAKTYATQLPKQAGPLADSLEKRNATIEKLNADQEAAKLAAKKASAALAKEVKAADTERQRILKYAEATFGARSPEVAQFRPATEARTPK